MSKSNLPEELLQVADQVAGSLRPFLEGYFPPATEAEGNFFHVCSVLTEATVGSYLNLRAAYLSEDQCSSALSCRDLLELEIFITYVLRSEQNLRTFAGDRLIDGLQIAEALRWLELDLKPHLVDSQFDQAIGEFRQQMLAENIHRKTFTAASSMARVVGLDTTYGKLNRLCSKFVHPTAWSLFTAEQGNSRFPEACSLFFSQGALSLTNIQVELTSHIKQFGLRHGRDKG